MSPQLAETLSTLLIGGSLLGIAGLGIAALPWSEAALNGSVEAWRVLGTTLGRSGALARRALSTALRPHEPPTDPVLRRRAREMALLNALAAPTSTIG